MTGAVFACLLRLHEASLAEALPCDEPSGSVCSLTPLLPLRASCAREPGAHYNACALAGVELHAYGSPSSLVFMAEHQRDICTCDRVLCRPPGAGRPARVSTNGAVAPSGRLAVRDIVLEAEQPVCSTQQPGFSGVQVRNLEQLLPFAATCVRPALKWYNVRGGQDLVGIIGPVCE